MRIDNASDVERDQTFQIETNISVTRSIWGPIYKMSYDFA